MVKIAGAAVTVAVLMITAGTPHAGQFFFSARALPWNAAARYCRSHGGHLATVRDARLNARLALAATAPHHTAHPPPAAFWLGLRRNATGVWRWLEGGAPAPFLPWAPGEPNGRKSDEECVELYVGGRPSGGGGGGGGGDERHGRWNDDGCRRKKSALCYRDQAEASRGSPDPGQESPVQVLIEDAPGPPRSGGRSTATPLRALPTAAPEVWSTAAPDDPVRFEQNPVQSTADPVRFEQNPVQSTADPVRFELNPVQSTADPVRFELNPVQSTADPVRSTADPAQFELNPVQSTADPVRFEHIPVQSTADPVQFELNPVQSTADPVRFVQNPVQSTTDPVQFELNPVQSTADPARSTIAPAQSTSEAPLQFEQTPVPVHWKPTRVRPTTTAASAPWRRPGARRKTRVEVQEPEFPVPRPRGGGGEDGDEVAGGGRVAAVVALGGVSLTSGAWLITFALKRRKSGSFFLQHNQTR
ncbi:unnamed protein product [Lampetra fluviatilis]